MVLREITYLAVVLRILAAVIFGGAIGLERGMKNRPAGLRTYMLVCVGSCLIMLTNQYLYQVTHAGDPMRLGAQVVSGIGFLGAGTIIVTKHNQIKGLTTAAGLWAAAGVGLALGVGFYEAAFVAGFAVFAILTLLQKLDDKMHRSTKIVELYIELSEEVPLGELIRGLRDLNLEIESLQTEKDTLLEDGVRPLVATLKTKKRGDHNLLIEKIKKLPGIVHLEEL
jgi:putative Mg2+ transporter-C (MgtC) family protein